MLWRQALKFVAGALGGVFSAVVFLVAADFLLVWLRYAHPNIAAGIDSAKVLRLGVPATFIGSFYLVFRLLEPRVRISRRLLALAAALALAWFIKFSLVRSLLDPPPGPVVTFEWLPFQSSSVVSPTEPYDVAMYHVYSDLLQVQPGWLRQLLDPSARRTRLLIRTETEPGGDPEGRLVPDGSLKKAVASASEDYIRRNGSVLLLQRRFDLPIAYDLITGGEEGTVGEGASPGQGEAACKAFQKQHPGYDKWVELSAVGFNADQTVAVVYIVEHRAAVSWIRECHGGIFATGGFRMLQKRHGKWNLLKNNVFSDWTS